MNASTRLTIGLLCSASTAALVVLPATVFGQAAAPAAPAPAATRFTPPPNLPRADANGNSIRFSPRTGHITNYDEAKVAPYKLPDPLVMADGTPVKDADTWINQRRPEILKLYQDNIYGRIPQRTPTVTWIPATDAWNPSPDTPVITALNGTATVKRVLGYIGPVYDTPNPTTMKLLLVLPAKAPGPVPVIFSVLFNPPPNPAAPAAAGGGGGGDPLADILAHGYAYATLQYTNIQPDQANAFTKGVIGQTLAPGQTAPAPDEWGAISAWAWGMSRVVDYLETEKALDAKRIAIVGHSRLGKTVLWAGALDPRIALVFSSCAGEMGSALSRRDWGESVDDMAENFPYQFAGNFQKFAGHWNDMPVDAHMLIALCAPRPVFITGGTTDQWADPRGEYLAEIAAGPVYKLLGKKDLGIADANPPLEKPIITGDLGFHYHTGGHAILASDWAAFFPFADAHLKPTPATKP